MSSSHEFEETIRTIVLKTLEEQSRVGGALSGAEIIGRLARADKNIESSISVGKETNLSQEFETLLKSTYQLEDVVKGLSEKLTPVLRKNLDESKLLSANRLDEKDAPFVSLISERTTHIQNIIYQLQDITRRVQIQN